MLEATGRLHLVEGKTSDLLGDDYQFHVSNGHTPGMLITEVATQSGPVVFAADLIPGAPWMHLPITMGYDRFPENLIDEKRRLLNDLLDKEGKVFFTHDPEVALGIVAKNEKGKFFADTPLKKIINFEL